MEQQQIAARTREKQKTRANKRLRRTGRVTAIVYGGHAEPEPISVDDHDMEMILHGAYHSAVLFSLDIEGKKKPTKKRAKSSAIRSAASWSIWISNVLTSRKRLR